MNKNKFYVTTPIYYVNAAPHLGSLYSTLLADVAARYHQLQGKDVFFLTGTDEHGQKIAEAAKKAGKNTQEFVDGFAQVFKDMWKFYEIHYTKFIRTTDDYHVRAVQTWITRLIQQGDIYKGQYTGWYCTSCETFVTEKDQQGDGKEVTCPSCLRPTNYIAEECYFFKLSAYQNRLLQFYENHPDFITPKERMHEVVAFVKEGLKDLSISRTTVTWGIPFPGDSKHVTYVWADALNNYITAIGYGSDEQGSKELHTWWPADMQVLGKDIVRFHAVYWPAFLMASGLEMPKKLLVHGWIKVGDQKMSKSLGNAIDPKSLADHYGVDQIRYYLMAKMAITQDSQFSIADIEQSINADLANDLGNLLNRCSTLAEKYHYTTIQAPQSWSPQAIKLQDQCSSMIHDVLLLVEQGYCYRALQRLWEYISVVNTYFHAHEPWKLAASDEIKFQEVIAATVYSLRAIGVMLWPVMPQKMETLLVSIGYQLPAEGSSRHVTSQLVWVDSLKIQKIETLFQKYEKIMEQNNVSEVKPVVQENYATIDDFAKIDMRVGLILECEIVEKSDKLLKMQVDLGELGKRQIFAGMRKYFKPEDLIGKQGIFVVNFKPRMMMGMPSEGMMLSAIGIDDASPLQPGKIMVPGTQIK